MQISLLTIIVLQNIGLAVFFIFKIRKSKKIFKHAIEDTCTQNLMWYMQFEDSFSNIQQEIKKWNYNYSNLINVEKKWISSSFPPTASGNYMISCVNQKLMTYWNFDKSEDSWFYNNNSNDKIKVKEKEFYYYSDHYPTHDL